MKIMSWNCRGLAKPSFVRVMKKLIKRHKPSIISLLETKVLEDIVAESVSKLGLSHSIIVDPWVYSSGLCLIWNENEFDIQATKKSRWEIHHVVAAKF